MGEVDPNRQRLALRSLHLSDWRYDLPDKCLSMDPGRSARNESGVMRMTLLDPVYYGLHIETIQAS